MRQSGGKVSANLPLRFTYCVPCKESSIAGPSRFTAAVDAGAVALALGAPFSGKLMVRTSARLSCILPYEVSTSIFSAEIADMCPTILVPSFRAISSATAGMAATANRETANRARCITPPYKSRDSKFPFCFAQGERHAEIARANAEKRSDNDLFSTPALKALNGTDGVSCPKNACPHVQSHPRDCGD